MNRKEIGRIVQGAGIIAIVAGAIMVANAQPIVAGIIVGGGIGLIVGHFINKGVKK